MSSPSDLKLQLWDAIEQQDASKVRTIVAQHPKLAMEPLDRQTDYQFRGLQTPLIAACSMGDYETIDVLFPLSDLSATSSKGCNALRRLIRENGESSKQHKLIQRFLETPGFNPDQSENGGYTVLFDAIEYSRPNVAKQLLSYCNATFIAKNGYTPLLFAVNCCESEMVEMLLPYSDLSLKTIHTSAEKHNYGQKIFVTALEMAVNRGFKDIVKLIENYQALQYEKQMLSTVTQKPFLAQQRRGL